MIEDEQTSKFDDLRRIKEQYIDETRKWYKTHWKWPWLAFRGAGIAVIILSLSIPLIAMTSSDWIVSAAALAVAALTALNGFFSWQGAWEKRIRLWRMLEGLGAAWEVRIAAAGDREDHEVGRKEALEATLNLVEETRKLDVGETEALLARIKFPEDHHKSVK